MKSLARMALAQPPPHLVLSRGGCHWSRWQFSAAQGLERAWPTAIGTTVPSPGIHFGGQQGKA